mmetsp:Transcript_48750/g.157920  ORF Transcript_48750/g.157920 Transcript_48750/m.157920 type:complete len:293 (+) Transcript_48750:3-881(+)
MIRKLLRRLIDVLSRSLFRIMPPSPPAGCSDDPPRLLLVGLGNPGRQYENTRHNVGRLALEEICMAAGIAPFEKHAIADVAVGTLGSVRVAAAMPRLYMNVCGGAVSALARNLRLPAASVLVLHDDLDLAPGKVKLKLGGSAGGHNGVKSCAAALGGDGFWRLRLGIGRPPRREDVADFVLERLSAAERSELRLERIARAAPLLSGSPGGGHLQGLLTAATASSFMNALTRPEPAGQAPVPERVASGGKRLSRDDAGAPTAAAAAPGGPKRLRSGDGGACSDRPGEVDEGPS